MGISYLILLLIPLVMVGVIKFVGNTPKKDKGKPELPELPNDRPKDLKAGDSVLAIVGSTKDIHCIIHALDAYVRHPAARLMIKGPLNMEITDVKSHDQHLKDNQMRLEKEAQEMAKVFALNPPKAEA